MRLVTVGTGTVVPDPERASACHWVESGETRLLVDCGAGALQALARAGLPWGEVGHLVVSHFHADHIGEIPSLIFALRHGLQPPRTVPLQVWGPPGTARLFDAWAEAFGPWVREPGFGLAVRELSTQRQQVGEFELRVTRTPHTEESLALRLEAGGSALGYTGDTGPADGLANFFVGVDLLLAECSLPDELVTDNHLSPSRLARLAVESGVARLVVTHVYPQLRVMDIPALIRAGGFRGEVIMAHDGLELRL